MGMTKKQRKALARHKAIVRKRNIATNNLPYNPPRFAVGRSRTYRLWEL